MKKNLDKVETLHNEGFCYIGALFHNYFTITGIKNLKSFFTPRGLRYKVAHYYIGVPLYNKTSLRRTNFANPFALRCIEVLPSSEINGLTPI